MTNVWKNGISTEVTSDQAFKAGDPIQYTDKEGGWKEGGATS